jgi:uncharacterized protein
VPTVGPRNRNGGLPASAAVSRLAHPTQLFRDFYAYLAILLADGETRRTIAHRFIADGDHVVVESVGKMQTKAGVPYNNEYCLIYRFRDGKIVEIREYCGSALIEKVLGAYSAERRKA